MEIETYVAELWRDVLNVPEVRGTDDFFKLGGHSLAAIHVVAAVEDRYLIELDGVQDLWDHPTAAAFAALIANRIDESAARAG